MKKLWLLLTITCANMLQAYTPTQGPLTFADVPGKFGAIRSTMLNNPHLQNEVNTISQFASGLPQESRSYQGMVAEIVQSQSPLALQTLQAFENIIMYMYHDKAFLIKIPFGQDFVCQGLRNSWFDPLSYLSVKSWLGDNNPELDQLLTELEQLAKIAERKSPFIASRMKTKVNLYRHWRKYILVGALSYLAYDRTTRTWNDTMLYNLVNDFDLDKVTEIAKGDIKKAKNSAYSIGEKLYTTFANFYNRKQIREEKAIQEKKDAIINTVLNFHCNGNNFPID